MSNIWCHPHVLDNVIGLQTFRSFHWQVIPSETDTNMWSEGMWSPLLPSVVFVYFYIFLINTKNHSICNVVKLTLTVHCLLRDIIFNFYLNFSRVLLNTFYLYWLMYCYTKARLKLSMFYQEILTSFSLCTGIILFQYLKKLNQFQ